MEFDFTVIGKEEEGFELVIKEDKFSLNEYSSRFSVIFGHNLITIPSKFYTYIYI